jgi:hypothetical protein
MNTEETINPIEPTEVEDFIVGDEYTIAYIGKSNKIKYKNIVGTSKEDAIERFTSVLKSLFKMWWVENEVKIKNGNLNLNMDDEFNKVIRVVDCNKVND